MKKIALIAIFISLLTGFGLVAAPRAHAVGVDLLNDVCKNDTATGEKPTVCKDNCAASLATDRPDACKTPDTNPISGPDGIMTVAVQIISLITGVAAVIVFIISGIRMIVSAGDSNSFGAARQGIIYASVGIVLSAGAQVLAQFVLKKI